MKKAKAIMVQGTMSGVGKSLLCAALCRIFKEDGYRVAPFKSQNMALNSFITGDGFEIGRAQALQAFAAGKEPDVRMNPILLKPVSNVGSQVILNGTSVGNMAAAEYFKIKKSLIPEILKAYNSLSGENDIIVIEGAGSPAEINLKADDIVNMGLAKIVDAPVLLAGDIDRGGVFAQLYGTVALLEEDEVKRIKGLIINKFRGDVSLLGDGLKMLEEKANIPVFGVVPYLDVSLEDEDSLAPCLEEKDACGDIDIAVIRLPKISNFTDFLPLKEHCMMSVRYVERVEELFCPDLVIIPGTKNTLADLRWLRQTGLESAIKALSQKGVPVFGICGGFQMLGKTISDPYGIEEGGSVSAMGLLEAETVFEKEKTRTRLGGKVLAEPFCGAFVEGYEIHNGRTRVLGKPFLRFSDGKEDGAVSGNVFGTYLHGIFDSGELVETLAKYLCEKKGISCEKGKAKDYNAFREEQLRLLAKGVRESVDIERIYDAMGVKR